MLFLFNFSLFWPPSSHPLSARFRSPDNPTQTLTHLYSRACCLYPIPSLTSPHTPYLTPPLTSCPIPSFPPYPSHTLPLPHPHPHPIPECSVPALVPCTLHITQPHPYSKPHPNVLTQALSTIRLTTPSFPPFYPNPTPVVFPTLSHPNRLSPTPSNLRLLSLAAIPSAQVVVSIGKCYLEMSY